MNFVYQAPHTSDGRIVDISRDGDDRLVFEAEFDLEDDFRRRVEGRHEEIEFAARSRIARLGIDIVGGPLEVNGSKARMTATARAVVRSYRVEQFLQDVFLPGVAVGRLVFCNREKRLASDDVFEAYRQHEFQLPAAFSVDAEGGFTIRPHNVVYDLLRPLTRDDLIGILARDAGKALLNRLQVPRIVEHVVLEPGEGVITSCSMFLHRHYVVLESDTSRLGRHMQATVLDPIATRGPSVFLEFFNDSEDMIVNPSATGTVYAAERLTPDVPTWHGTTEAADGAGGPPSYRGFLDVGRLFATIEEKEDTPTYFRRPVAVATDVEALRSQSPSLDWHFPVAGETLPSESLAARCRVALRSSTVERFGTRVLDALPEDAAATLLMRYFPNLGEHGDILHAALQGKVCRLVFERASFEHGTFLSARDHGRLADYHDLGMDVYWQNHDREHLVKHVFRGRRGFWCEFDDIEAFRISLIASVYGSSRPLTDDEAHRLSDLLSALRDFFGEDLSVLTGGGPGSMLQASNFARDLGLLVGANYLEIEDQKTNKLADYYQVFQENCRHSRQRWFEIASFPIFCVGGVGTLEEIGMTLTDIKLGLVEGVPLVFFGGVGGDDLYWRSLVDQLHVFADERRGPGWLRTHVLLTNDPDEVVAFYKRTLSLG